jgi:hypothetical protein
MVNNLSVELGEINSLSITTSLEIVRSNIATSLGEISEFVIASTSYGFGFELDWSTDILSLEFV